jgi:hypothetical protein
MSKSRFIVPIATSQRPFPYKLCKNCKHFKDNLCHKYVQIDLVSGSKNNPPCYLVRYDPNYCGVGGKDFEPIDKNKK